MLRLFSIALTWQFIGQIALPTAATQQQCYYPQGNPSVGDIPTVNSFELSRASCTDSTWQSENCPSHCTNVSIDKGIPIALYSYMNPMPPQYCCGTAAPKGDGSIGCSWSPYPFTLEQGVIIPNRGILNGYIRAESIESNSTCPPNSTCPKGTSSNTVIAVGAGLGAPLGTFLIAALFWALWERHQRRNEAANARRLAAASTQIQYEADGSKREIFPPFQPQDLHQPSELRHDREPIELG
ncbi:hypothetical protein O1611_g947 [Lasiodiplodia mahajangana]|uniref:Uncharacterized protein n=1 Tax=Lasiodiplodia mahajangana TaxID=1108764 RepID=A0ACC2JZ98_9PEZI|nr:hypothetical protein O1611_g947 [Lasiodiplodia mahajangana]